MTPRHGDGRIGVVLLMDSLPVGGAESLLLSVLSGLDSERFRPSVLCLRSPGDMAPRFRAAGVPVHVLGHRRARHLLTPTRLVSHLRRNGTDVMLLTSHHGAQFFGPICARLAGVAATVVSVHMTGGKTIGLPTLPRIGMEQLRLSRALVAVSDQQVDYLRAEEGLGSRPWRTTRVAVISNGVSRRPLPDSAAIAAARAALGLDDDEQAVGIVAALRSEKAHEVFLRAGADIVRTRPRTRLVLIGDGDRRDALEATAAELSLGDRVLFAGYRSDARDLVAGFDVSCLTSIQETFPIAPLESLEAGVPVVMTDCGDMGRFIDHGGSGWLVPVGDHRALAERVLSLLDDAEQRRAFGVVGRARVHRDFSLDATVSAYADLFAELVAA